MDKIGLISTWRKRFFMLKGSRLIYYKDKPSKKNTPPAGLLSVLFVSVISKIEEKDKKKSWFQFHIHCEDKVYKLRAQTDEERDTWMKTIQEVREQYKNDKVEKLEAKFRDFSKTGFV